MNSSQRMQFVSGLQRNNIRYREGTGGEIAIQCPRCNPLHGNTRMTLYVNVNNDRWHCFRCEPERFGDEYRKFQGRKLQLPRLLNALGLRDLALALEDDEIVVEEDSLQKARQKLLRDEYVVKAAVDKVELPEGYRTDWNDTFIGKKLLSYLLVKRNLTKQIIDDYRIGYIVLGKYAGGVVLPVYMKKVLRFWQIRRVMMAGGNVPKYDSPRIGRRSVLFGYDDLDPENTILVEGIFDAISVNGVALLGKEITDDQISLLANKAVSRVTCMLDGEAWRDNKQLAYTVAKKLWTVKEVVALRLPFGKDPNQLGAAAIDSATDSLKIRV
jgi:hypothetical protein